MDTDILYKKSYGKRLSELGKLSPETFKAFIKFDQLALSTGSLTKKTKELIAVAVAHVTGCPYCIDSHVRNAQKLDVSKEEMLEAIMVATALKAGSSLAHSSHALNAYENVDENILYKRSNSKRLMELREINSSLTDSFFAFDKQAMKENLISGKDKELMAVAIAHVTGCPYCIDGHTKGAKKKGASMEEITEAIFVATALKAGSALAHSVNALNAYDA
jgi:AhpD family alkylhydroperoxidase